MNDAELRALVRDAVARHLGPRQAPTPEPQFAARTSFAPASQGESSSTGHVSHAVYLSVVNADDACVIQPSVPCDHCGYCKSHGH